MTAPCIALALTVAALSFTIWSWCRVATAIDEAHERQWQKYLEEQDYRPETRDAWRVP